MVLKFTNSMGNKLEEFKPIKAGHVGLYTCGPTIYNYAHIGNMRAYAWEDLLKRYLIFKGFKVKHVMNFTDVEDKIIKHSKEKHVSIYEYTAPFKKAFLEDLKSLNILPADVYPEATAYVPEMVELIRRLIDKGFAYKGEDGCVYFSIKKFKNYGKLAGLDPKKLKSGARVKQDEYEKEGVGDFALWKAWDDSDGAAFWETDLGRGRPGWHIECSAMSAKNLGDTFDIHCGGIDNKFPHHENEIAQSEAASGKKFVNYWLHCAHLMVNGMKMSKSLGNFYTLRDVLKMGLDPKAVRYVLLYSQYRQPLNFTIDSVNDAKKTLQNVKNFVERLRAVNAGVKGSSIKLFIDKARSGFVEAMDDDLNVPEAMKHVFDFVKNINKLLDAGEVGKECANEAIGFLKEVDSVLGVFDFTEAFFELSSEQKALVEERIAAKKAKDWARADEIRNTLRKQGVELVDNKDGTITAKPVVG